MQIQEKEVGATDLDESPKRKIDSAGSKSGRSKKAAKRAPTKSTREKSPADTLKKVL